MKRLKRPKRGNQNIKRGTDATIVKQKEAKGGNQNIKRGTDTTIVKGIRVITKLPNSEQSYKGKVKTHNYINRQNQSTTGKL